MENSTVCIATFCCNVTSIWTDKRRSLPTVVGKTRDSSEGRSWSSSGPLELGNWQDTMPGFSDDAQATNFFGIVGSESRAVNAGN